MPHGDFSIDFRQFKCYLMAEATERTCQKTSETVAASGEDRGQTSVRREKHCSILHIMQRHFASSARKGGSSLGRERGAMNVLVTAGPTREPIDEVRFLTNRSTGKMGYALAEAARDAGHKVILVSGPVSLAAPPGIALVAVESAAEMAEAVKSRAPQMALVIMCAAVADYRPKQVFSGKMKKRDGDLVLELERTEDILYSLGRIKPDGQLLVGFAAETDQLLANAAEKLKRKNLDWICANDVGRSDIGFGSDKNRVTLLGRNGRVYDIGPDTKRAVADAILKIVTDSWR